DVTCIPLQQDVGFCRPLCLDDDQCAGKKCDPSSGTCVDNLAAPAAIGDHCDSTDAGPKTCGFCLSLVQPNDAGQSETVASFCSSRCRLLTPGACSFGSTGLGGFCLLPSDNNNDVGDLGYCVQLCDTTADCSDKADGFVCDTSFARQIGHGYCNSPSE